MLASPIHSCPFVVQMKPLSAKCTRASDGSAHHVHRAEARGQRRRCSVSMHQNRREGRCARALRSEALQLLLVRGQFLLDLQMPVRDGKIQDIDGDG